MAVLSFRWGDLEPIYRHAQSSSRFSLSLSERVGAICDELGISEDEAIKRLGDAESKAICDAAKGSPGLFLVGDRGVYLMSAGLPVLSDGTEKGSVVAYAEGIDPDRDSDWCEVKRSVFGGDDGADKLPLAFFEDWLRAKPRSLNDRLEIRLTSDSVELVL